LRVADSLQKLPAGTAPVPAAIAAQLGQTSFQPAGVAAQAHVKMAGAQSDGEKSGLNLHGHILLYYGNIISKKLYTIKAVSYVTRTKKMDCIK